MENILKNKFLFIPIIIFFQYKLSATSDVDQIVPESKKSIPSTEYEWHQNDDLLVLVFSSLHSADLLNARSVCKTWNKTSTINAVTKAHWDVWSRSYVLPKIATQRLHNQSGNLALIRWFANLEKITPKIRDITNPESILAFNEIHRINKISRLIPYGTNPYSIPEIIQCMSNIHNLNAFDKQKAIRLLAKIDQDRLLQITKYKREIFTAISPEPEKINTLIKLNKVPIENIPVIAIYAQRIYKKAKNLSKDGLIESLAIFLENNSKDHIDSYMQYILKYTNDICINESKPVLSALAKFPLHQFDKVEKYKSILFPKGIDYADNLLRLGAFAMVPSDSIALIAAHAPRLYTDEMDNEDKSDVLKAMVKFNQAHIPETVDRIKEALEIFNDEMPADEITAIIESLSEIHKDNIPSTVEFATQLFTENMDGHDKAKILKAFTRVPTQTFPKLIDEVSKVIQEFIEIMTDEELATAAAALIQTPAENISIVVQEAKMLFTKNMKNCDKAQMIKDFSQIPLTHLHLTADNIEKIFTAEMRSYHKTRIIEAFSKIPENKISSIIELILKLFSKNTEQCQKARIIESSNKLSFAHIEFLYKHSTYIADNSQFVCNHANIIEAFSTIPAEHFPYLTEYIEKLFTKDMDICAKAQIFGSFALINTDDIPETVEKMSKIIREIMIDDNDNDYAISRTIAALAQIPISNYLTISRYASELFTTEMNADDRSTIFCALTKAPIAEIVNLIVQIKEILTQEFFSTNVLPNIIDEYIHYYISTHQSNNTIDK